LGGNTTFESSLPLTAYPRYNVCKIEGDLVPGRKLRELMTGWNVYDEEEARRDPAVRLRPAFQLSIADVRPAMLARFASWRGIPGLLKNSEAFEARMEAVTTGKKARVDFKRTFIRFIKSRFPDYPPANDTGEMFRCLKPLDERLALGINWTHKAAWGLGKMLHVEAGARWDNKTAAVYHSLPYFLGSPEPVNWAYISEEDLDACFEGAASFLEPLLPMLAEALPKRMAVDVDLGGAGPVSAREGYAIARRLVDGIVPSPDANGSASGMELQNVQATLGTGLRWGASFSPEGRVRAHAMWVYSFKGRAGDGASVSVPSLGDATVAYQANWGMRGDSIREPWIDSVDAMAVISSSGRVLEGAVATDLTLGYFPPYLESPTWRSDHWVLGKGLRCVFLVDARNGRVVWMHP
jgi:hypothetical protein